MKKFTTTYSFIVIMFISKLAVAQGAWEWAHLLTGENNPGFYEMSTDKNGNTYILGSFRDTCSIDSTTNIVGDSLNILVLKINSTGGIVWTKSFPYKVAASAASIAAREDGGCYITGQYQDSITFGSFHFYDSIAQSFFISLDSLGNVVWAFKAEGNSEGKSVICDKNDRPVFTGSYSDSISIGGNKFINSPGLYNKGAYVIKTDENGGILWSKNITGDLYLTEKGITITGNDEIIMAAFLGDTSVFELDTITSVCTVLAKYDSSGNMLWVRNIIVGGGLNSLNLNASGQIFCVGSYQSLLIFQTITVPYFVGGSGDFDGFIAAYDSSGSVLWANYQYCQRDIHITDICHAENDLMYFTGRFGGDSIIFSNTTQTIYNPQNVSGQGFFGVCNSSGDVSSLIAFEADQNNSIDVDSMNNLYLAGWTTDTVYMPPFNLPLSERGILMAKYQNLFTEINTPANQNSFLIWPNPSRGNFTIQLAQSEDYLLTIYNITGVKEYSIFVERKNPLFNVSLNLSGGLYFAELMTMTERRIVKLVVY